MAEARTPVRVLIAEGSAVLRSALRRALSLENDLEVVAVAADAYQAREHLIMLKPDVVLLDLHIPGVDGLTFIRSMMAALPTPVVAHSAQLGPDADVVKQAKHAGANVVLTPSSSEEAATSQNAMAPLIAAVRAAGAAPGASRLHHAEKAAVGSSTLTTSVIALGASTGGVAALCKLLPDFGANAPAVVVVQHMPSGFTGPFARRLDQLCAANVVEGEDQLVLLQGHIYVGPGGDRHCEVARSRDGGFMLRLVPRRELQGHCPSVDHLFFSMAAVVGKLGVGCLLTGMGSDGAIGLLAMRFAGAATYAQAQQGCAVWGMPGAAHTLGAARELLSLDEMAKALSLRARAVSAVVGADRKVPQRA